MDKKPGENLLPIEISETKCFWRDTSISSRQGKTSRLWQDEKRQRSKSLKMIAQLRYQAPASKTQSPEASVLQKIKWFQSRGTLHIHICIKIGLAALADPDW